MRNLSVFIMAALVTVAVYLPPAFCQKATRTAVIGHSSSYLGVGAIDIDDERAKALNLKEARGVEIKSVDADSPAAKAGLKDGDVVLDFNGQPVAGTEQFARLVRETPAGRTVHLSVWRGGSAQTISATVGTRPGGIVMHGDGDRYSFVMPPMPVMPAMPAMPVMPDMPQPNMSWRSVTLGVETESLTPQLAEFFGVKEGALVRSVIRNSAAEKAGIKAGDVIVKVDETAVTNSREISSALRALRTKKTFPVTVVRNRQEQTLQVTMEDRRGMRESLRHATLYC